MKKLFALLFAVMLIVSIASTAFAANATPGTTVLTTEVPAATYVLNIPADQTIQFGKQSSKIGNVTVTNGENFAEGKNVDVTLNYEPFKSESVTTQIPYKLFAEHHSEVGNSVTNASAELASGSTLSFSGKSDGTISETASVEMLINGSKSSRSITDVSVRINSSDWGKALAAAYSSNIVFTAEVVVQ